MVACSSLIIVAARRLAESAGDAQLTEVGVSRRVVLALMSDETKLRWTRLLAWLEDKGMRTDEAHLKVYRQERSGKARFRW